MKLDEVKKNIKKLGVLEVIDIMLTPVSVYSVITALGMLNNCSEVFTAYQDCVDCLRQDCKLYQNATLTFLNYSSICGRMIPLISVEHEITGYQEIIASEWFQINRGYYMNGTELHVVREIAVNKDGCWVDTSVITLTYVAVGLTCFNIMMNLFEIWAVASDDVSIRKIHIATLYANMFFSPYLIIAFIFASSTVRSNFSYQFLVLRIVLIIIFHSMIELLIKYRCNFKFLEKYDRY